MAEQEGITVKKAENFSEWYTQVVEKAELSDIRYNVKGFVVFRPWAVRAMELMYDILEAEMQDKGHVPAWFPAVIPESNFKKEAEHVEGFGAEVFWITEAGSEGKKLEERLALRPTSETAMYKMYSIWIRSWRDLPLKIYQRCQVWRYEGKATRPFIRSREFHWIEGHDAFATREGAEAQVREDMEVTGNVIHKQYAIPFIFFQRPEHDKFPGAIHTYAADALMPDGKVIQLPSTHLLGQNFSKPFDIKFTDKDGSEKHVWQTCYGPAVSRIFAAVVGIHGDDKGLVLPPPIAPIQAIIVPIYDDTNRETVMKEAEALKKRLKGKFRVDADARDEYTPGWKFNHWELKGVPLRIEIGPKEIKEKQIVIVRRDTGQKKTVPQSKAIVAIKGALRDIHRDLTKNADSAFKKSIRKAGSLPTLKKMLREQGGIIKVHWCGSAECADYVKAETDGGVIRGTPFGREAKGEAKAEKGRCIWCKKGTDNAVYIARQY
jgi:prolyl-tRNA synthetase